MWRLGRTGWSYSRRRRGITDSDDMKTDGCLVAGQKRVEHSGRNLDAEIFVVEFYFAVSGEDAVSTQRRMHRYGHRMRLAVERQVAGDNRGAFAGAGHDDPDHAAALESDGWILVGFERFFSDVSIA